ncbi:MAG: lipoate--protein ligase family protein [Candidatus Marinimicrobia bacterium]|nr:lipoate--protein ligase family protein [Candidatus Neomarinimicrobiota bacterium]MBT3497015.1 lipoate--protein ligase family protein [Candidatus Neomarinimicrobiota bacterium]MBT3692430.1 lipoate--protein ligase family protein [Candidatus Neomarinimicrobiota bacterium]MBT4144628.1 lipoate--protein ligase family protein [Candidatus Neomarinimicrobiota bacterium]MBT4178548.1 lipoate--protein ligase family protein [Candidatus Neomarinimicrobiota bacterium]
MNTWRYIENNDVTASAGLAADEVLANRAGTGISQPTLRLYTYQPCALVGRFQTIENELNLDYCVKNKIPVNRRPTGGGAIIMGENQLGVALAIPGKSDETYASVRERMAQFSQGIISGLATLGINVEFRRKNDLEVNGKKIAGLGLHKTATGGLLFHASLLVDLDVAYMLNVLQTPFEKISDKEISSVAERTTTIQRENLNPITLNKVRRTVLNGYKTAFGVNMELSDFSHEEMDEIRQLEKDKYMDSGWIFQSTDVTDAVGKSIIKTDGGLLDIHIVLAGRMIKSAYIGGDFFTSEHAIADLEQSLRWHSSQDKSLTETLTQVYERWSGDLANLPMESLIKGLMSAIQKAEIMARKHSSDPYGCFVTPGSAHA